MILRTKELVKEKQENEGVRFLVEKETFLIIQKVMAFLGDVNEDKNEEMMLKEILISQGIHDLNDLIDYKFEKLVPYHDFGKQNILNFAIVGAQKCGTTALRKHLLQHPDIFMPRFEDSFFYGNWVKTEGEVNEFLKRAVGMENEFGEAVAKNVEFDVSIPS